MAAAERVWTRRRMIGAAAMLTGGLAAACAPGSEPAAQPGLTEQPVEVEYWDGWTGVGYAGPDGMVAKIMDSFMRKHPAITVRQEHIPGGELVNKLTAATTAGTPPDVVMLFNSDGKLYSLANGGLIQPLEKVANSAELKRLKDWVHPAIWDLGIYNGKVYGLAMWTQSYAIVYNKAHFREVGLNPDRGPQTLDELATYAEKLTKRDSSAPGGYARLGFYDDWFQRWLPVFDGQLVDQNGKKITANHPNNIRCLEWLAGWFRRYDPDKIAAFRSSFGTLPGGPLGGEKYSMIANGPWYTRTVKEQVPTLEYGVSYLPSPPGLSGLGCFTYGDIPAVPNGARHGDGAWKLVQFLLGFDDETGGVDKYLFQPQTPTSEKAYKSGVFKKVSETYPGFDVWAKALFDAKRFLFPPKIPTASGYGSLIGKYIAEARNGKMTPKEALERITQEAQAELDQVAGK
ncbi:MAG TPA: extracellular solute-binding protein [Chloroflexota bacterium]|nr:extracellular solute-binding protein [Chloroflexota bacterium]